MSSNEMMSKTLSCKKCKKWHDFCKCDPFESNDPEQYKILMEEYGVHEDDFDMKYKSSYKELNEINFYDKCIDPIFDIHLNNVSKIENFKSKYPNLFQESCCQSGFYLPEGWNKLVHSLCFIIENYLNNIIDEEFRKSIYIVQVKEKFGTLRFYVNESTSFIDGAIAMAESMSASICEKCGNPGRLRSGSYVKTLCDNHV